MEEIRQKAKQMGIMGKKYTKADLIRKIQIEEGNQPCFKSAKDSCEQMDCCWRKDCLV